MVSTHHLISEAGLRVQRTHLSRPPDWYSSAQVGRGTPLKTSL